MEHAFLTFFLFLLLVLVANVQLRSYCFHSLTQSYRYSRRPSLAVLISASYKTFHLVFEFHFKLFRHELYFNFASQIYYINLLTQQRTYTPSNSCALCVCVCVKVRVYTMQEVLASLRRGHSYSWHTIFSNVEHNQRENFSLVKHSKTSNEETIVAHSAQAHTRITPRVHMNCRARERERKAPATAMWRWRNKKT